MSFDLLNSSAEDRAAKKSECTAQSSALETKINDIKSQINQLTEKFADKLSQLDKLSKNASAMKAAGGWSFFLGVAAAVVSCFFFKGANSLLPPVIGLAAGAFLVVLGVCLFRSAKKCAIAHEAISGELTPYYEEKAKHQEKIQQLDNEISVLADQIQEIDEYEMNQKYYELANSTGHILTIVTGELDFGRDGIPYEPSKGSSYIDFDIIRDHLIYVDGTVCGVGNKVEGEHQSCWIAYAVPSPTAKTWRAEIDYNDENARRVTYPENKWDNPWVSGMTIYKWYHVSQNDAHTLVYPNSFTSLEDFRKALSLTKEEIINNI